MEALPVCGHAHEVVKVPAYLEVEHYLEAEHIVKQMEKHLHTTKKPDFSPKKLRNCAIIILKPCEKRPKAIMRNYPAHSSF